jgi:hypothetical protein
MAEIGRTGVRPLFPLGRPRQASRNTILASPSTAHNGGPRFPAAALLPQETRRKPG